WERVHTREEEQSTGCFVVRRTDQSVGDTVTAQREGFNRGAFFRSDPWIIRAYHCENREVYPEDISHEHGGNTTDTNVNYLNDGPNDHYHHHSNQSTSTTPFWRPASIPHR
ncbi:hypothetical protein J437_LFUL017520, partial [Ladona fulva]